VHYLRKWPPFGASNFDFPEISFLVAAVFLREAMFYFEESAKI
jgi:hypothetical protein